MTPTIVLAYGAKEAKEISKALNVELTGLFSEYLDELTLSGFIKRDYTWHLKNSRDAKLSKYRLSDNYLRFYLRYIDKYRTQIDRNGFKFKTIDALPEWDTVMGLQFENLVLNNRHCIHQALGLTAANIVNENPFFQKSTIRQRGCQIDYMIQTAFGTLYICEIKFSKKPIGKEVIHAAQQKINRLKRPKGFSCRPVLVHVNGVSEEIVESDFFAKIIDMSEFLK